MGVTNQCPGSYLKPLLTPLFPQQLLEAVMAWPTGPATNLDLVLLDEVARKAAMSIAGEVLELLHEFNSTGPACANCQHCIKRMRRPASRTPALLWWHVTSPPPHPSLAVPPPEAEGYLPRHKRPLVPHPPTSCKSLWAFTPKDKLLLGLVACDSLLLLCSATFTSPKHKVLVGPTCLSICKQATAHMRTAKHNP